jgi:hypothetical protein
MHAPFHRQQRHQVCVPAHRGHPRPSGDQHLLTVPPAPPISHPGPGSHRAQTRSVRCSINRRWQGVYPIGQITGQRLPPPPLRENGIRSHPKPRSRPRPVLYHRRGFQRSGMEKNRVIRHGPSVISHFASGPRENCKMASLWARI